jgi:glucose-6-phosphate 1-dehydrogenase
MEKRTVPAVIDIFGGTDDLAKRKLILALYNKTTNNLEQLVLNNK